eukprot:gene9858-6930_t
MDNVVVLYDLHVCMGPFIIVIIIIIIIINIIIVSLGAGEALEKQQTTAARNVRIHLHLRVMLIHMRRQINTTTNREYESPNMNTIRMRRRTPDTTCGQEKKLSRFLLILGVKSFSHRISTTTPPTHTPFYPQYVVALFVPRHVADIVGDERSLFRLRIAKDLRIYYLPLVCLSALPSFTTDILGSSAMLPLHLHRIKEDRKMEREIPFSFLFQQIRLDTFLWVGSPLALSGYLFVVVVQFSLLQNWKKKKAVEKWANEKPLQEQTIRSSSLILQWAVHSSTFLELFRSYLVEYYSSNCTLNVSWWLLHTIEML